MRKNNESLLPSQLLLGGGILAAMIIGGITAFLFFYFKITHINIQREEGDSNIRYAQMIQMFEYAKGYNILILSTEFLEESFQNRFPELASVEIKKEIPNTLNITTKPDVLSARWIYTHQPSQQQFFGYISEKTLFLREGDESLFPIFDIHPRPKKIEFYTKLEDGVYVPDILRAKQEIENILEITIVSAHYLRDAQEVHFQDENEKLYWLFLGSDIDEQLLKLRLAKNNYFEAISNSKEYIDLRIGESIIYK